jgi:REP element-mobilizing transposase RayT
MARPLRIEFPGALYHVTTRGNAAADIVADDVDRAALVELIGEVVERASWLCHAYCLMDNHYHLLVETPAGNLSRGMRHLNGVHTQRFNRRHGRVGHVFQGRYKAILVERDAHLLELARYVALNPVRAHLVGRAEDWPWSSYRATAGLDGRPDWLTVDWLLAQFAPVAAEAQRAYAAFVGEATAERPWRRLKRQIYLGGDDFVAQTAKHAATESAEVPRVQRAAAAKPLDDYRAGAASRRDAMADAYASGVYSMSEIARHFGVHYTTVSRAVRAAERAVRESGSDKGVRS